MKVEFLVVLLNIIDKIACSGYVSPRGRKLNDRGGG